MKFRSLKIERPRYGAKEGKLVAEIQIEGKDASITLDLPEDVANRILKLAKDAIIDGVEKTANDFIFELTTAIPETICIGNKP